MITTCKGVGGEGQWGVWGSVYMYNYTHGVFQSGFFMYIQMCIRYMVL
jgi:hypothetical protein